MSKNNTSIYFHLFLAYKTSKKKLLWNKALT